MRLDELADTPEEAIRLHLNMFASRGRPFRPALGTVRFLAARQVANLRVHLTELMDLDGRQWHMSSLLARDAAGRWYYKSGGAGPGVHPTRERSPGVQPYLHVATSTIGSEPPQIVLFGSVISNRFEVVRLRLSSANGTVLEGSVVDNLVLLPTAQHLELPFRAELYDRGGVLLARQSVPRHLPHDPTTRP